MKPSADEPAARSISSPDGADDDRARSAMHHELSGADEPFGFGGGGDCRGGDGGGGGGGDGGGDGGGSDGPDVAVSAGMVIGDVVIVRALGDGGMGSVYEGRDRATGRPVAVKLIRDRASSPEARERFVREARLLARMRHPHVAQIHAFGTHVGPTGPLPYLVLELVEDARPITHFARDGALGVRDRVRLLRDACLGVAHAHERGVVHRDIKPGNLLVDAAGSPRVIDFGVARSVTASAASAVAGPAEPASFATTAGAIVGTLQYMSPEQILGHADAIDGRSDVYALGLVLHELVVGRPPYDLRDASYFEAARVVGGAAAPPTGAVARVVEMECGRDDARALAAVVAKSLEKAPADRYASAGALAADLGRWLEGRPVGARPPTAWESVRRFARRHRAVTAAAGVTAAVLVVALGAISMLSLSERRQRREAEAARRSAETARVEAEHQAMVARDRLYLSTVLLAAAARDGDNIAEAGRLLEAARGLLPATTRVASGERAGREPIELSCLAASLDESSGIVARTSGGVTAVAIAPGTHAPGSRLVAVAGLDGRIHLGWLSGPGRGHDPARHLAGGHEGRIWRLAFSPDGRWLASAGADGRVVVRDVASERVVVEFQAHEGPAYGAAFSPDGSHLATAGRDGSARLWDATTWQERAACRGHRGTVYAVAFAGDGSALATAGADHTARIWDAASGRELAMLAGHDARVFDVAFSADGGRVATAAEDGTARLWDRHTAVAIRSLRHPARVNAVAFVNAGSDLATASGDGVLRLWRSDTGAGERLRGHTDTIWTVAADGAGRVVTGSGDGTARHWRTDGGDAPVVGAAARVHAVAYAPDGSVLAAGLADGAAMLWHADSLEPQGRLSGGVGRVNGVAFSPDRARLAGACDDGTVVLWSPADAAVRATWRLHSRRVYAVAFAAAGRRLATASEDGTGRLWDGDTGEPLTPPLRHGRRVFSATFSPDDAFVATASEDRSARLWHAGTGGEIRRFLGHDGPVNWVAFAPDGRRIATASSDATVRLWTVADGSCAAVLTGPARQVWKVAFSPDGTRVAGVSADGTATIWDVGTGHVALVLRGSEPDGPASGDEHPHAPHVAPRIAQRRGHVDQVWGVAFSPDGRRLATGSWDGTVRIWGMSAADTAAVRGPIDSGAGN